MSRLPARITPEDFEKLIRDEMSGSLTFRYSVERLEHGFARLRLYHDQKQLRPGGTIAGPVMFTLADIAFYAAVLATIGMVPLAVTTDMNIHFLRKPQPCDLIAEARLLKQGRRLLVGEVLIYSDGIHGPVAHVTGTYAIPSTAVES